jgi:hypothetical protein
MPGFQSEFIPNRRLVLRCVERLTCELESLEAQLGACLVYPFCHHLKFMGDLFQLDFFR